MAASAEGLGHGGSWCVKVGQVASARGGRHPPQKTRFLGCSLCSWGDSVCVKLGNCSHAPVWTGCKRDLLESTPWLSCRELYSPYSPVWWWCLVCSVRCHTHSKNWIGLREKKKQKAPSWDLNPVRDARAVVALPTSHHADVKTRGYFLGI